MTFPRFILVLGARRVKSAEMASLGQTATKGETRAGLAGLAWLGWLGWLGRLGWLAWLACRLVGLAGGAVRAGLVGLAGLAGVAGLTGLACQRNSKFLIMFHKRAVHVQPQVRPFLAVICLLRFEQGISSYGKFVRGWD